MALAPKLEQFIGKRVARRKVVEAIASVDHAFPMDELYQILRSRSRGFPRATMYRTVRALIQSGLMCESVLKGGKRVYQLVGETSFINWVCDDCGTIRSTSLTPAVPSLIEIANKICLAPFQMSAEVHYRCNFAQTGQVCPNAQATSSTFKVPKT